MNTPHPLAKRYLAAMAAAAFARTAAADPPLIADGSPLTIAPGTYETTGDSEYGLVAINGGKAKGRDVYIATAGKDAYAIHISSPASAATLIGGGLHTLGVGAHGLAVRATRGTAATLTDVDILTEGASAAGASFALDGAHGQFRGGHVETLGYAALGIEGDEGGQFSLEGTTVVTRGKAASGLVASGNGSSLEAIDASVETLGDQSHGIYIDGRATATVTATTIVTAGADAYGLNANVGSGITTVSKSAFQTSGNNAVGVMVHDGARVAIRDTTIETSGLSAAGVDDRAASLGLQGTKVITHGKSSHGVIAKGGDYTGKVPRIDIRTSIVTTEGAYAYGVAASKGGQVEVSDSDIRTTGANAHGLWTDNGEVIATNSTIDVSGKGAYGAIVSGGATLEVDGGRIVSRQGAALGLDNPDLVRIVGGAMLSGGNGSFAEVDPTSSQAFTVVLDEASVAVGDIRLSDEPGTPPPDETKLSLDIRNGATWSGSSSIVRHLSVESGGTWTVTGDSRIGSLRNDHGIVIFSPAVAGAFGHLTIAGDYEGKEGLFRMRGRLGDDTSPADLIHVMGNTSGLTHLAVDSLDGEGANTNEGIPLVRVDGRSEGAFELAGRAVAGAHEYFLHKGSVSQPDDGDWYLRAYVPGPDPEPEVEPETGGGTDEPVDPVPPPRIYLLRPEVGAYRANQTAALDMFQGGPGAGEDDERDDTHHAVWARFERRHTTFDLRDQLTTTTSTNELTLGSDLFRGGDAVESHVGVMAAVGQSDTRGRSLLTHYSAKGRVRGAAGGIYAGLRTDKGSYVRGWTQYAHFSQYVEGDALRRERYGSGTLSTSIEAGHRWRTRLGPEADGYIEPQAQIIASRLRGGTQTEANGTRVAPAHARSVTARVGTRAAARWQTPNGHVASPYVATSWIRRLGRLDATQVGDEAFSGGVPRNSYALKLGVAFLRKSGWRLWGDVETRFGARNYRRVAGRLGIRKAW